MVEKNQSLSVWHEWNHQGFIPGLEETETAFQERVAFCQHLESQLEQEVGANLPFEVTDKEAKILLEEVLPFTQKLYGIQPRWTPIFFSNYQLTPWHGGCAWIFQLNEYTPTAAFLQLRKTFRHSLTFLGIYNRRELIAHELAHVGRMMYQEPQFEEMLAYQSSSSCWRRWLGPIVQSSKESFFFIFILGTIILADFALLSLGTQMLAIAWWLKLIPLIFIALAAGRLLTRHYTFKKCLQHLESLYFPQEARHLRYRLLDNEIKQFSKFSPLEIRHFIERSAVHSFRWRFLKAIYPISIE